MLQLKLQLLLLLLLYLSTVSYCYQQESEQDFLSDFNDIVSQSYSVVNDPNVAPSALITECKNSAPTQENLPYVNLVATSGNTLTSNDVASQCPVGICVLPASLSLIMDGSLSVDAIEIKGDLLWNDDTQTSSHQWLCAGYVSVEGRFELELNSADKKAWVYIKNNNAVHPGIRSRSFGGVGDSIVIARGRELTRTWSLLSKKPSLNTNEIELLHTPQRMGWKVGDRVAIGPTGIRSNGTGETFKITGFQPGNKIILDGNITNEYRADFFVGNSKFNGIPTLNSAEVVNLSRNVIITGDDFTNIPCDPNLPEAIPGEQTSTQGCRCASHRSQCTMGLHIIQMNSGFQQIENTRIELCGQRGVEGKYCLHFHQMGECPDCIYRNNAIENGMQRGIIVHGTHLSLVSHNVLWDVRGGGIYFAEDGNEMKNTIAYNVVICPWPLSDNRHGCTIPGTSNGQADTSLNQAGFYTLSPDNHMIGNRASNSFNGMLVDAGIGRGGAYDRVCTGRSPLGRFDGNTFHSHGRFGTYMLNGNFPKHLDTSTANNGYFSDKKTCDAFTQAGEDRGLSSALVNHFDYGNAFVGHYNGGDIQYRNHVSVNNLNLLYWKESKSFSDKCSAFLYGGYYRSGNLALPDNGALVIQDTKFDGYVQLEFAHHCNVGVTGVLCFPTYILHNVDWRIGEGRWVWFQGNGGLLILSPTSPPSSFFPDEYISLVPPQYPYLLDSNLGGICSSSGDLGLGGRYDNGILCRVPLRALKIYSRGLVSNSAPALVLEIWNYAVSNSNDPQSVTYNIPFHQIGGTNKQGFSLPVVASLDFSYRISLSSGANIPDDWVIEFSDPIMEHKFNTRDSINLSVAGRDCGVGVGNFGIVTSQHDRKFIVSNGMTSESWGHGACTEFPDENNVDCSEVPELDARSCPDLCDSPCPSNSYCSCNSPNTCECLPGYFGSECEESTCNAARCSAHGKCTATYLGKTLPVSNKACVCEDSYSGPLCDLNPCDGVTCSGNGTCKPVGDSDYYCDCNEGFTGDDCSNTCNGYCTSAGGVYPYGCATSLPGIMSYFCGPTGGCYYSENPDHDGGSFCKYKVVANSNSCVCPAPNDCHIGQKCNSDGSCPLAVLRKDGYPCNSEPYGVCQSGVCVGGTTLSPTIRITNSPNTPSPTEAPNTPYPITDSPTQDFDTEDCSGVCTGNGGVFPFGCALNLPGQKFYRCLGLGCHYAEEASDPYPDGFCLYHQLTPPPPSPPSSTDSPMANPTDPTTDSPTQDNDTEDCSDVCTGNGGVFPFGCALNLPGKKFYRCLGLGCHYAEEASDPYPDGFCLYHQVTPSPTDSPMANPTDPTTDSPTQDNDTEDCSDVCTGNGGVFPFGCALNLSGKKFYRCFGLGCHYAEDTSDPYPDGFCLYHQVTPSPTELPTDAPSTPSPSDSPTQDNDTEDCSDVCTGNGGVFPFGCALNLSGQNFYRCLGLGCHYAEEASDPYPDGFCLYHQLTTSPTELPTDAPNTPSPSGSPSFITTNPMTDSPSQAPNIEDCTGVCTGNEGLFPFGCALDLPGINFYRCHEFGCHYTEEASDPYPDDFCLYYQKNSSDFYTSQTSTPSLVPSSSGRSISPTEFKESRPCISMKLLKLRLQGKKFFIIP